MKHFIKPLSQSTPSRKSPSFRPKVPASHYRPKERLHEVNNSHLRNVPPTPGPSKRQPSTTKSNAPKKRRHALCSPQRKKNKVLREIVFLQKNYNLLIQKLPFARVVRELAMQMGHDSMRFTVDSLLALQEASEYFLISFLEAAYVLAHHGKRVTLMKQDLITLFKVMSIFSPGSIPNGEPII